MEKSIGASKGQHFSVWYLHVLLLAGSNGCANTRFPLCKLSRRIEQRLHLSLLLPTPHRRWVAQKVALPRRLLHLPDPVVSHQFVILMCWSFVLASHGGTAMAPRSWGPVCVPPVSPAQAAMQCRCRAGGLQKAPAKSLPAAGFENREIAVWLWERGHLASPFPGTVQQGKLFPLLSTAGEAAPGNPPLRHPSIFILLRYSLVLFQFIIAE